MGQLESTPQLSQRKNQNAFLASVSRSLCMLASKQVCLLVNVVLPYCQIHGNLVDFFFGFSNFQRLVNGCIDADFCVQGRIFQRFSSSTFFPLHHSRIL